jgi:serine/threonine-protein kinase
VKTCQHCGFEHEPGLKECPRTGEPMDAPGLINRKVDRYQVLKLLGAGGFGAVYRAKHARTDAQVALKVMKQGLVNDDLALDRFMREAKAAASIGDDHVVRVLDAEVTSDGLAFIAMELLVGVDLRELDDREGPLSPSRVLDLICQVLDGLEAAHQKGVVHRDMKPGNVFIVVRRDDDGTERERAKLLDFGISKMIDPTAEKPLTATNTAMGTPGYMAFEQFFNARDVDARADVYAVSAMTFELLAGRKPFIAETYAELVMKVRNETAPSLRSVAPSLPAPLCAVIDKGLQRKRERRWDSAAQMAAALRGLASLVAGTNPARKAVQRKAPRKEDDETDKLSGTFLKKT